MTRLKRQSFLSAIVDMGDGFSFYSENPTSFLWSTVLALPLETFIVNMVDQEVLLNDFLARRIHRTEWDL